MARAEDAGEGAVEPAWRGASPFVGPAVLRPEHLRAMRRVLERELPERLLPDPVPPERALADPVVPALEQHASGRAGEPLPLWTPPSAVAPRRPEACPSCGESGEVVRVDLTANAGWLRCGACGRCWGGAISSRAGRGSALAGEDRERGHAVTG